MNLKAHLTTWLAPTVRIPVVSALSLVATLALFLLMRQLVISDFRSTAELPELIPFDFVRLPKAEPQPQPRKTPQRPDTRKRPPSPKQPLTTTVSSPDLQFNTDVPYDLNLQDILGLGDWSGQREPTPILRVSPVYPPRASRRGLEGWVEISFTITSEGTTADVQVIKGDPPGIFDRAAVQAIRKWKYKPQRQDGQVSARSDVHVIIKFELDQ